MDDLFDDEPLPKKEEPKKVEMPEIKSSVTETKPELNLKDFQEEAPMLPQENDDDLYDLQKELEAKFDELFGPIDE